MNNSQQQVLAFCQQHNLHSTAIFALLDLISELGEVAKECLITTDYGKTHTISKTRELELELGDVFFSLLCLANSLDIDMNKALDKVLAKYQQRMLEKNDPGSR